MEENWRRIHRQVITRSGTISKRTSKLLQIDSYATHGSSGSPVFDAHGLVIGVIYAGATRRTTHHHLRCYEDRTIYRSQRDSDHQAGANCHAFVAQHLHYLPSWA